MRTLYTITFALLFTCGLNAQIIFESNLDNWNDSVPNDWFGSKTSLEVDSADMVTTGATYGTALAQLTNLENSHKRFTTEPLSLEEGQTYEVEVWVKGSGEIRTNLYDGSGGNGYNDYNAYVPVTSDLSSFVQTIFSDTTSSEQEVILSFRNGVVEVDRVEVRVGMAVEPTAATIYEVQFTTEPDGNSPLQGLPVITSGVVTAVAPFGYYIQDGQGVFSGLYVDDDGNTPTLGDEVSVTGTVEEYYEFTRIINVTDFSVVSSGNSVDALELGTAEVNDEQYEGMLVMTVGFSTEAVNQFDEWPIDDGSGAVVVDDQMYQFVPEVGAPYMVVGALNYSFEAFKIEPRDMEDVEIILSVSEESTITFEAYPNPASAFLRLTLADSNGAMIEVMDMAGRSVKKQSMNGPSSTIDVSDLDRGHYVIRITTTGGIGLKQVTLH